MSKVTIYNRLKWWSDSRCISTQKVSVNDWNQVYIELDETYSVLVANGTKGYVLHKLEELIEYVEAKRDADENGVIDAICDSRVFDATELLKEGYDIEKCDNEVLMVVESRTGMWSDKLDKFIKDTSKEAISRRYKPDYVANCKLIVEKTTSLFGFSKGK